MMETVSSRPDPASPERRRRTDATRNRAAIVAAARAVYAELGPSAPFDAIAKRAGVANGTLYRHFANAAELRDAIFAARLEEVTVLLTDLEADPDPGRAFEEYLRRLTLSPDASLVDLLGRPGHGNDELRPMRADVRRQVEELIARAAAAGAVRADFTIRDLDVAFLALAQVGLADWVDAGHHERFLTFVLAGLRP
jgi:AcrR family transcriptional regulator